VIDDVHWLGLAEKRLILWPFAVLLVAPARLDPMHYVPPDYRLDVVLLEVAALERNPFVQPHARGSDP
jgi:hypothetical protein